MSDRGSETTHRYPWHRLRGDYIRAAIGLALCLWLLLVARGNTVTFTIIALPTIAFAVFGLRTWLRHTTLIKVTPGGLSARPAGAIAVPWHNFDLVWRDLTRVKLSYYSTKRDKTDGWMQMTLRGAARRLTCDSNLEGFERIARLVFDAARRNGIEMSTTTMSNFHAMGIGREPAQDGWGDPATWRPDADPDMGREADKS